MAVFDGNYTTDAFSCSDDSSYRLENSTFLWTGSGRKGFWPGELRKLAETDSITVTLQPMVVYANMSREVAKGRACQDLELDFFKWSRFAVPKHNKGFKTQDGKTYTEVSLFSIYYSERQNCYAVSKFHILE